MRLTVQPIRRFRQIIEVPGDKSISHRSIILASLANGKSEIHGFLRGEDTLNTIRVFRKLGIQIDELPDGRIIVYGKGLDGLKEPADILDFGNSGTGIRLTMGVLAAQKFYSILTGDASIRRRPMGRVIKPLEMMGARFLGRDNNNLAPISVFGQGLNPIAYNSSVASAQVKSAILLAGLFAEGETSVSEPAKSRDHTERMLKSFGADLKVDNLTVSLTGRPEMHGQKVEVPGDISSAAFFMVAAAICPKAELIIKNVGINTTRSGIIGVLQRMGAKVMVTQTRMQAGEQVADLWVQSSELTGIEIGGNIIPNIIDEIPIIAVAAAAAQGETIIRDAHELRVKESDRIRTITLELQKAGVDIEEREDGIVIRGGKPIKGTVCQSHGDHRIAMSMAVAGLIADGEMQIENTDCVNTSFPGFEELLRFVTTA